MSITITNTRWLVCNRVHGREMSSFEFSAWNRKQWLEFERELVGSLVADHPYHGPRDRLIMSGFDDVDARYDAWLLKRYPEEK